MVSVSIGEANANLSDLVAHVERLYGTVEITRDGRVAAVLMSKDALDALHETLYWLAKGGDAAAPDEPHPSTAAGPAAAAPAPPRPRRGRERRTTA